MRKWYEFDPERSFIALPILWVWVVGIAFGAFVSGVLIAQDTCIVWSWNAHDINNLLTVFKVPLGIFALIIPIVALLASNHRSVQTKAQILASNQQNIFSNYYKHIEEFEKYLDSHISPDQVEIESKRKTHKVLFPDAIKGDPHVSNDLLNYLENEFGDMIELMRNFSKGGQEDALKSFLEIQTISTNIQNELGIFYMVDGCGLFNVNGVNRFLPGEKLQDLFLYQCRLVQIINTLLEFDATVKTPEPNQMIRKLNLAVIPKCHYQNLDGLTPFNPFTEDE